MPTTVIRNAAWTIAWDPATARHVYRRGIDVVFEGNVLTHVGPAYAGPTDAEIDGRERLVMPGLVNIHSHPGHEPIYRGIREEHGTRNLYMSGLFERSQAFARAGDDASRAACSEFAYCELLKSGVTSLLDIGPVWDGWAALLEKSGLRAWLAPGYASARWRLRNDHELTYAWDETAGKRRFAEALACIDALGRAPGARLSGVVSPMQIDTCSEELLRDSLAAARERRVPFTVHIAQGVSEVQEMIRRHGLTPVQWAARIGILGPHTILGHAIFLDAHSWVRWWTRDDLQLIAQSGCSVAHCPTPFARYGAMLEDFGAYRRAGINMGMGTDCSPHNMLEEIRKASTLARVASRDMHSVSIAELLHAATVGGAQALGRTDIGALEPGRKADLVLVDLASPDMAPVRDPLRSLVFHAAERAVRDVFVDGRHVVQDGVVRTLDQAGAGERMLEAQQRAMASVPEGDFLGRSIDVLAPLSLPLH